MELIDSYVHEVSRFLPQEQRAEIVQDLRNSIEEELDAVADEGEIDDEAVRLVLAGFGHPLKVASRYQPNQYLIGPDLYPAFARTLRTMLVIVGSIYVLGCLGLGYVHGWTVGPISVFFQLAEIFLWVFVIVLSVFAALQFGGEHLRWYEQWSPSMVRPGLLGVIDRSDVITNLISEGFFLLWLNGVIVLSWLLPDGFAVFGLSTAWNDYAFFLNVLFGAAFVLHAYVLIQGMWSRWTTIAEIALFAAMVGLGIALVSESVLVEVVTQGDMLVDLKDVQRVVKMSIWVIMGITVWDLYVSLKRLMGR